MLHYTVVVLILYLARQAEGDPTLPRSQQELMNRLLNVKSIETKRIETLMYKFDRKNYDINYEDIEHYIGHGAFTNPATINAYLLERLQEKLVEGARVLDLGCGSGYMTMLMAGLVGDSGLVVGVDHIEELVNISIRNAMKDDENNVYQSGRVMFVVADGRGGYPDKAPYDVIHVGASVRKVPKVFYEQMKIGGRMVVPVGEPDRYQKLMMFDKKASGKIKKREIARLQFFPLTRVNTQLKNGKNPEWEQLTDE